jgi:hypothetical protein
VFDTVAELGALSDDAHVLVDDRVLNVQAADRLAQDVVDVVTATHRSILRDVVDRFRAVVAVTPLLGTGTRRQAAQDAMRQVAGRIASFVDRVGRRWSLGTYAAGRRRRPSRQAGRSR